MSLSYFYHAICRDLIALTLVICLKCEGLAHLIVQPRESDAAI